MSIVTSNFVSVVGGVDTPQDLHTAAVVSTSGEVLGTASFSTTRAGYRAMLHWFRTHGELLRVGVEATGTYGAGITRHLALAGIPVLEVTRPDPARRRAQGKDDTLDAVSAAQAALTGQRVQVAKDRAGAVEALRVLRTRKTAVKCRRATLQQLHNTTVAAPDEIRDQVRNLTRMQRLRICAAWRPDTVGYRDPVVATRIALKSLARRILELNDEIAELDRLIGPLVEELAAPLLKGWALRTPVSSSSRPVKTLIGSVVKPASQCFVVLVLFPRRAVRHNVTGSIGVVIARPIPHCIWLLSRACASTQSLRDSTPQGWPL